MEEEKEAADGFAGCVGTQTGVCAVCAIFAGRLVYAEGVGCVLIVGMRVGCVV